MGQSSNLFELLQSGAAPKNLRMLVARGLAPLPPHQSLQLLVFLLSDTNPEIAADATRTLSSWDQEELAVQLNSDQCPESVLKHFAVPGTPGPLLQAIVTNPAATPEIIEILASFVPAGLLEIIADNRVRILQHPSILESIRRNPGITPQLRRIAQEIETEFFAGKKTEYAVAKPDEPVEQAEHSIVEELLALESDVPLDDFSLEGLPVDEQDRQAELTKRLTTLSVRQKIKQALFGNREVRSILVRDTNKEVARSVLRSPKLTANEVESIAAMRSVSEDILRDIGSSREWIASYAVVHNLVRNPKTPPAISQRLIFRLQTRDLMMLARDRSVSDAVRHNANRTLNQRSATRSTR